MKIGESNVRVINKLVNEHYKEPENGTFDDVTASVLEQIMKTMTTITTRTLRKMILDLKLL